MKNTIEEIKAYGKTYEYDKVTVMDLKKAHSHVLDEERYIITLQVERDTENLGRKYEYEEEKVCGFFTLLSLLFSSHVFYIQDISIYEMV